MGNALLKQFWNRPKWKNEGDGMQKGLRSGWQN